MKKLTEFTDDEKFYCGTVIILKGVHVLNSGCFDKTFGLVLSNDHHGFFDVVDLYLSFGMCVGVQLRPNIDGHFACNKTGIFEWVKEYFNAYYYEHDAEKWIEKIEDMVYIKTLSDYFESHDYYQTN